MEYETGGPNDEANERKRVIVITVCLSKKITDDEVAYRTLIEEISNLQNSTYM